MMNSVADCFLPLFTQLVENALFSRVHVFEVAQFYFSPPCSSVLVTGESMSLNCLVVMDAIQTLVALAMDGLVLLYIGPGLSCRPALADAWCLCYLAARG